MVFAFLCSVFDLFFIELIWIMHVLEWWFRYAFLCFFMLLVSVKLYIFV